eukprot:scaffold20268_cov111-Isochrysis_galbana.AAC.12
MRQDTLRSPGRLASPSLPPPPFTVAPGPGARPGWGYGGGPRRGVGRCGLAFTRGRQGRSELVRAGPLLSISCPWSGSHCDPTEIGVWEIGCPLGCAGPSRLLLQAAFCGGMVSELRALQQPGQEY